MGSLEQCVVLDQDAYLDQGGFLEHGIPRHARSESRQNSNILDVTQQAWSDPLGCYRQRWLFVSSAWHASEVSVSEGHRENKSHYLDQGAFLDNVCS